MATRSRPRELAKLAVIANLGGAIGLAVTAELTSADFMLHLISTYVYYDEIAGTVEGIIVGMALYSIYAVCRVK
jgi:hypothetical protein